MQELIEKIKQADETTLNILVKVILEQYQVVKPDMEVAIVSLHKKADRNKQIDNVIQMLQNMKTSPGT